MSHDPSKYMTQLNLYRKYGFAPGNKLTDWLRTCITITIFIAGLIHFPLYIKMKDTNGATKTDVIEAFHWSVAYVMFITIVIFMVKYRSVYYEIDRTIRTGVYDYGDDFTEEQRSICDDGNRLVLKLSKIMLITFLVTSPTILTKQTIFRRKPGSWNPLFKGWTPFVINSWTRYIVLSIVHVIMTANTGITAYLFIVSFLTFGIHLVAQLKVLRVAMKNILDSKDKKTEEEILAQLKKCAAHHAEIKRKEIKLGKAVCKQISLFQLIQLYSGTVSGILPIGSVGMICTLLYDMTGDNTVEASFIVILPEASLVTTYALIGQYITNESEKLRTFLYQVDWYVQPVKVQKHLLFMMLSSMNSLNTRGFGVFKYSLEGLTEVMQTTYTFYNTLNATR